MAIDYIALRDELIAGHPVTGAYSLDDVTATAELNALNVTVAASVTVDAVRQYLITQIKGTGAAQRSSLDMIREYAQDGTVNGLDAGETGKAARVSGAQMIWYMLNRDGVGQDGASASFPIDDANIQSQFISLGPDGGSGPSVLSGAELNAIDALATSLDSRANELGFGRVRTGDVQYARTL